MINLLYWVFWCGEGKVGKGWSSPHKSQVFFFQIPSKPFSLAFGIERLAGKEWDIMEIGQIVANRFSNRWQHVHWYVEEADTFVKHDPLRSLDSVTNILPDNRFTGDMPASSWCQKSRRRGFGERHFSRPYFPPNQKCLICSVLP